MTTQEKKEPETQAAMDRPAPIGDVTISGRALLWAFGSGVVAIVLLSIGLAVALLGLQAVRDDLASLRQAISLGQAGRPPGPQPPSIPAEPVSLAGAQTKGNPSAKVAIMEFSDFQCPFCSRFTLTTYRDLTSEYLDTGKVLLAFRHLPLDQIHPYARKAAEAAECAGRQGKFWEMHDRLFVDPSKLTLPDLETHASAAGLGVPDFKDCLAGDAAQRVAHDVSEAARLEVYGTPGFLLGTIWPDGRLRVTDRLSGAQPIGAFRVVLDRLLASID
jgi:protein-disulfide isomerase